MTDVGERGWLTAAAVSATVVVLSIATGMVLGGDIPEALWFLLVPIGMLGGGVVAVIAPAMFLARRNPSARRHRDQQAAVFPGFSPNKDK